MGVLAVALTRRSSMVLFGWRLRTSHCLLLSCQVVAAGIGCRSEMVWGPRPGDTWERAGFQAESPSSSVRLVPKASSTLVALRSLLWLQLDESVLQLSSWRNNRIPCPALPMLESKCLLNAFNVPRNHLVSSRSNTRLQVHFPNTDMVPPARAL